MDSRRRPAHGVQIDPSHPTIVFVTACTKDRRRWLTNPENQAALLDAWRTADAWVVRRYVLMPDHLHLFAAPGRSELPLDNWVRYWKSRFTRERRIASQQWQVGYWDTRLRSDDSYDAKWHYVRNNPVRAGLVQDADEWPYQGEMERLAWT